MTFIKEFQHLKISLQVIESATDNFTEINCIGSGGFGKVYKGEILLSGVLNMVAIKRLDKSLEQGATEFWQEILMLSQYKHENIVSLIGFCDEGGENILVYEYLSNKSLDLYLNSVDLSWYQRLSICLGAAMGLQYLHEPVEGSQQRVLHRDIRSANILLDQNWRPKIADFGLSKLGPANQQFTFLISNAVGTMGYCDPLYVQTSFLTKESDVYSFGVVLFEVLCGRPCVLPNYDDIRRNLAALSRKCYDEKKMDTIIHIGLQDNISPKCLERFSAIAYQCLQLDRAARPTMGRIVQELTSTLTYQLDFVVPTELFAGGGSVPRVNNIPSASSGSDKLESSSSQLKLRKMSSDVSSFDKLDSPSSHHRLEKSKTERPKRTNILVEEASQIFDQKLSVHQKLKLLNRIATVNEDGMVEFEIPADVEPRAHRVGAGEDQYLANEDFVDSTEPQYSPPLQIVMLVVGNRGDVQPFVAIGKRLQMYGHRVRLSTHSNFKEFVLTAGLEFYPLGGDPKVLAEFMVKRKGFLPSGPSEIFVQRSQMKEIIYSLLPACKEPDLDSNIPFKADAIIANPPAYGQTHVAEALKIPIHIFFTMPWTPTSEFPHPLSRVKQSAGYRLSYQTVDSLIWIGIRDIINDLRKKKLKLPPVTYLSGSQGSEANIPHGYIWSPHLVPKPKDWGPTIDVVGFCFLDLASNYEPPEELVRWLMAGPKPIYFGFGSLPVQEPEKMTEIIVKALETTGQRGIINKGWGGLGNLAESKDHIYSLDNVPHDWLFLQCASVVHHGGAGTTAEGLKAACPTTVISFFGDQPFWGERIHARGVGPPPIPVDEFTLPKLIDAIKFMLDPKVKERVVELAKAMENEDGVDGAVKAFLRHLPQNTSDTDPNPPPSSSGWIGRWMGK
uniref:sterol 3-beta-glucosyltransferase UGT80A2-like n=1 Tax=Erigeron canadensis TaxID=72917 RepID=UPI001CB9D41A|nr:sterol 3-beta-glucosyltransferase UGT80A2-like [Erigeron canadensis]